MKAYYDLSQCWVQYHVGFILFKCVYVDVCFRNVNQYYRKKKLEKQLKMSATIVGQLRTFFSRKNEKQPKYLQYLFLQYFCGEYIKSNSYRVPFSYKLVLAV